MKAKVILDIGFLGHAHAVKTARRGAQRVVQHLFEGLSQSEEVELTFVATSYFAGAHDFLASRGLNPEKVLLGRPGQLERSRAGYRIAENVHKTMADRSWLARIRRRMLAKISSYQLRHEPQIETKWLAGADIYHSPHTPFASAVQQDTRIKKFLTCHDFIPLKNPEFCSNSGNRFMQAVLACLQPQNFAFAVSETTRNDILNLSRMSPDRVFVTPLAADPEIFHPANDPAAVEIREKFNLHQKPYFLALSAHDPHKNFRFLVECFGSLVESGELPDHHLMIVGANPARNPETQKVIATFPRLKDRIIIPGYIPDEKLAAIYSGARAFLFPSLAEGFGIPPLEAMQCGVPVLASNTTSIPEVVGDAGLLLSPTNRDDWCQAIIRIAGDDALHRALAGKSVLRAKLFSWKRFTEATLLGYRRSLKM